MVRARTVFAQELAHTLRRPLFWFLVFLVLLMSWGMSTGDVQIASGDSTVGGTKAWLTSEFSFAFVLVALVTLLYSFFLSIAAGMAVIRDDDFRMGEMLHATPLRPGEYVWGKFLGILTAFLAVLGLHILFTAFFNHVMPNPEAAEIRGPFELMNYLRPAVVFALPALIFFAGISFYLGERLRRPMSVFLFPVAVLLFCGFFLWDWSPTWLDPRINRVLMLIDPGGFRWLNETWLKLDRGARFYNETRIGLDLPFVLSRLAFLGLGLLGVVLARRHLDATVRGRAREPRRLRRRRQTLAQPADFVALPRPLAALAMRIRPTGFLGGLLRVARTEARNLLSTPAVYVFDVLILLQTIGNATLALGAFQTKLLLTPGQLAVASLNPLTMMLCLLLMFYTTESLERERSTGLAALAYSAPIPTASILFGKALANSLVGVIVTAAAYLGCVIVLLIDGKVAPSPGPFLLIWGLLLVPTLLLWTSFITCVQAVTGQRFATYGVGLGVLVFTLYRQFTGGMNWLGNWMAWGTVNWTDMGVLELDRKALVLNRTFALGLAAFFVAVAVRAFDRRQSDPINTLHRLQGPQAARSLLRLAPFAIAPLVLGIVLGLAVLDGFQGGTREKKARDYWKQNLATWKDAPQPSIAAMDLDLKLEPERSGFHSRGTYELFNDRDAPLSRFALTGGMHWKNVKWTLQGKPYEPEDRSGLFVFKTPLAQGGRVRVGFEMDGQFPEGITKNGGGLPEFILPSGVVLTSFRPTFVPMVGYDEDQGIKEGENDYEPRVYPEDFYKGQTDSLFGLNRAFRTRVSITGPAGYTWNSVGTRVSDTVKGGLRTSVWESDHPVRFFNVVGGRWKEKRGKGTVIYYHPEHEYNIAEMSAALDASRRWYSEWFHPFPWRELKLSEFPNLARYAQGFPTNITFSEGIGFLTESDVKTDAVFLVTAHETAHQWWGNILTPGKGPGGNILSEGTSHFSTLMLLEQVKGPRARMEAAKRLEENYGEDRRADAERPLVWNDGTREGDQTVTYDKGGWVFWMLLQHMGRDRALAGIRQFMHDWAGNPDHPVLQDFLATMRPFAPDPAAFDAFAKQWFHEVVLPEYELTGARKVKSGKQWKVTVQLENAGTGRMPVAVAAVRGERFGKGYLDARTTVTLGAGESKTVTILCPFDPERLVVDPDVQVLQIRRNGAQMTF
ncbi:MAG TPA: ABC transporter permease subunit [Thermoanaerobaculia bacterium]|jgi:ABC-type transport system involved in multi-copper enzyme maturation permease subunit|nr:ABC transporter permease subunit [Thermoanaerobaculia bacterium]